VSGLSRRAFLTQTAALAALTGLDAHTLGGLLAEQEAVAAAVPSTLVGTVLQGPVTTGSYRRLLAGPGEPYLPRLDVLGRAPGASRTGARRSLLYLGHLSDLHVIDSQSPGRIEPMIVSDHTAWGSQRSPARTDRRRRHLAVVRADGHGGPADVVRPAPPGRLGPRRRRLGTFGHEPAYPRMP